MNRRTFIQSLSAAMATLATGIKFEPRRSPIDYGLFCDDVFMGRYDLNNPFVQGDHLHATDARILIRTGEVLGREVDTDIRVPNMHEFFKAYGDEFEKAGWSTLPENTTWNAVSLEGKDVCEMCYGKGRVGRSDEVNVCSTCGGYAESFYYQTSRRCACGAGYVGGTTCEKCCGTGWHSKQGPVHLVDGLPFNGGYINKVRTLGEIEYRIIEQPKWEGNKTHLMAFRFDGGVGLLMGIDVNFVEGMYAIPHANLQAMPLLH